MTSVVPVTSDSLLLPVDEQSQIGAARRSVVGLGHAQGLSAEAVGRLALVVTEAATNILRHAGSGVVLLRVLGTGPAPTIEVLALDKGPGIRDLPRAMADGFSTSGTAGHGLGAMKRLSETFEIYTQRGAGTALLSRITESVRKAAHHPRPRTIEDRIGAVCVPIRGESVCGDAWRIVPEEGQTVLLLADGLGHGPGAAVAAALATAAFAERDDSDPEAIVARLDRALRGSRGAAISVAVLGDADRVARFCGVGNVDARVVTADATQYFLPQPGIVGHTMPTLRSSVITWPTGGRMVMHSDGVSARWRMDAYPGLATAHPALVAGVLYRDFSRDLDDATVLVFADAAPPVP